MTRKTLLHALPFTALAACLAPGAGAQDRSCPQYMELAEKGVPADVGDMEKMRLMLNPTIGPQLPESFDLARAMHTVEDTKLRIQGVGCMPDDHSGEAPKLYRSPSGSALRVLLDEGRIVYLNRTRRFDAQIGPDNQIPLAQATDLVRKAGIAFGIPEGELDLDRGRVRELMVTGKPLSEGRAETHRAEVQALFARHVGGVPVFDSFFDAAVATSGKLARLHIRWPAFCLVGGLSPEMTLDRQTVVALTAQALAMDNSCGSIGRALGRIAYVQHRALEVGYESADETPGANAPGGPASMDECYVPMLVIHVIPPNVPEDSGIVAPAGEILTVPLLMPPSAG